MKAEGARGRLRWRREMAAKIRPVYCGNFEYDARQSEIERLFKEYGRVDRVDMKTGKFSCLVPSRMAHHGSF